MLVVEQRSAMHLSGDPQRVDVTQTVLLTQGLNGPIRRLPPLLRILLRPQRVRT